jgi:Dolichyl-phosphate-mannose-protein mannosyltransferase
MIDFGFAALLALIAAGIGRRLLDSLGQSPEDPSDALALALPLGLGLVALATLVLGQVDCLNRVGLSVLLAVLLELSVVGWFRLIRDWRASRAGGATWRIRSRPDRAMRLAAVLILSATLLAALAPVTDGDALCYHLQVPKVFLMRGSVGFAPDLHETVYPLVTEMLYLVALEWRGPVACRVIEWFLGLAFAANVTALARPLLGRRAWWAGAIALLSPAVSNGMCAPLNDVSLAAFGTAAIFAWVRLQERPSVRSAVVAGLCAGLAAGVKYPALVLVGLLATGTALRVLGPRKNGEGPARPTSWLWLAMVYGAMAVVSGGCWYLRAYHYTGNPVYPFFRHVFHGAGLDQVLAPIKRPLATTPLNLLLALGPLTLEPDRFDSFSHQFGPVFLLFLPALLVERLPRRVLVLAGLGYLFLMLCLTQRQSMRFVLIALGPMSVAVAALASRWVDRKTLPARLILVALLATLGFEAAVAAMRPRHALSFLLGRESAAHYLARREPTYTVGQWAARNLPPTARVIGQDHRGFYIPREYTMELAHRRRTGLGGHGESADQIVAALRGAGFTHLLLCPPMPESAVEFDPTLGRLLAGWTADRDPLFRRDLVDNEGVVRRYTIYDLRDDSLLPRPPADRTLSALSIDREVR